MRYNSKEAGKCVVNECIVKLYRSYRCNCKRSNIPHSYSVLCCVRSVVAVPAEGGEHKPVGDTRVPEPVRHLQHRQTKTT